MSAQPSSISGAFNRPFAEQVAFFRNKLGNLVPTARWDDLKRSGHDTGFMVAGAAKADLLADLASAVERVVTEGKSIEAFRKDFRAIVQQRGWHGWTGEGSPKMEAWRTRIIYTTNANTAYAAGRHAQLQAFAFWIYRHSDAVNHPRPQHVSWNGLTLPKDHPFWKTHYPPNGWGCHCYVVGTRSASGAKRLGGDPNAALPDGWDAIDPKTGTPVGIDKGWDYAPGASVAHTVQAMAQKTVQWPYTLAKAYMQTVPESVRDALATSYRALPSVADDARRYAQAVLDGRKVDEYRTLGLLTTAQSAQISQITNSEAVTSKAFDWAFDASTVRKVLKDHGDDAAEAKQGQSGVTTDDYALIPQIISDPDKIEDAGKSDVGRPIVRVIKRIGDVTYVLAVEVRSGRQMLALQSMWKVGRPPSLRP